jgi:hypothetical protein
MAIVAVALAAVVSIACDPGRLPEVPSRQVRLAYEKDWFPTTSEGPLPLDLALQRGDVHEVRRLLESGADPNARWSQSGDRFPIQEVLESESFGNGMQDPVEMIALLLRHGADPNMKWCPTNREVPTSRQSPAAPRRTG